MINGSDWYPEVVTNAKVTSPDAEGGVEHGSCDQALVRAFDFLGKRWSGVIIGTLSGGAKGFAELSRHVEGISDSVLSERLGELQAINLIERRVEPGPPVSVTYRLSEAGGGIDADTGASRHLGRHESARRALLATRAQRALH